MKHLFPALAGVVLALALLPWVTRAQSQSCGIPDSGGYGLRNQYMFNTWACSPPEGIFPSPCYVAACTAYVSGCGAVCLPNNNCNFGNCYSYITCPCST